MNIYDIAELAGASIATVSRVLNDSPNVAENEAACAGDHGGAGLCSQRMNCIREAAAKTPVFMVSGCVRGDNICCAVRVLRPGAARHRHPGAPPVPGCHRLHQAAPQRQAGRWEGVRQGLPGPPGDYRLLTQPTRPCWEGCS